MVNRHCHPDGTTPGDLDAGLVAGVLVLNRLLAPQPLVHVETWLAGTALPDLWGLEAPQCNDDRLARTLDAWRRTWRPSGRTWSWPPVRAFGLDLSRLAYDLTSVAFCGAYEEADLVRFGYSRDHRPDRQQVELATTVTLDGGRARSTTACWPATSPTAPRPSRTCAGCRRCSSLSPAACSSGSATSPTGGSSRTPGPAGRGLWGRRRCAVALAGGLALRRPWARGGPAGRGRCWGCSFLLGLLLVPVAAVLGTLGLFHVAVVVVPLAPVWLTGQALLALAMLALTATVQLVVSAREVWVGDGARGGAGRELDRRVAGACRGGIPGRRATGRSSGTTATPACAATPPGRRTPTGRASRRTPGAPPPDSADPGAAWEVVEHLRAVGVGVRAGPGRARPAPGAGRSSPGPPSAGAGPVLAVFHRGARHAQAGAATAPLAICRAVPRDSRGRNDPGSSPRPALARARR